MEVYLLDNSSNASTGTTLNLGKPDYTVVDFVLAVVVSVICAATLFFNSVLIFIIARTKTLHTTTNAIIVSLTCSDLTMGAFVMPFAAFSRVHHVWPFSPVFCQFIGVLNCVSNAGTILNMMAIAIDRFIAVSKPLKYSQLLSPTSTGVLLCYVWTQSLAFAMLPVFGWGLYLYDDRLSTCVLSVNHFQGYVLTKAIACDFVPFLIICLTLLLIFKSARSHHRIFTVLPLPIAVSVAGAPSSVNYRRTTMKAMRTLCVIVFCFTVLWLPYTIIGILQFRGFRDIPAYLLPTSGWLAFASSAVNPLIITALNKKFKENFAHLICCCSAWKRTATRVAPAHFDHNTHVTGLHSTYDTTVRESRTQEVSQVFEGRQHSFAQTTARPEMTLRPPSPHYSMRRPPSTNDPNG